YLSIHAARTELYTLSLHDALPISWGRFLISLVLIAVKLLISNQVRIWKYPDLSPSGFLCFWLSNYAHGGDRNLSDIFFYTFPIKDRKSTRLNSSHVKISYAVFCLK